MLGIILLPVLDFHIVACRPTILDAVVDIEVGIDVVTGVTA